MFKGYKLRKELLYSGLSEKATEMYVYIDQATKSGKKGIEVFENKTLVDRVQFSIFGRFDSLQPHMGNFEKLYDDPVYRQEWMDKYNHRFSN